MKKIPTMFERDWEGDRSRVLDKPTPGCEWVFAGEGVATRKYDGMACMFDGTTWYKRREVKKPENQHIATFSVPAGMVFSEYDEQTGKAVGWVPIGEGPEDKYLREATLVCSTYMHERDREVPIGTYEFLGPKSQGNVEQVGTHSMWPHDEAQQYPAAPRTFDGLRDFLAERDIEGIVFHHEDGRMAKIKKRDFGLKRKPAVPA